MQSYSIYVSTDNLETAKIAKVWASSVIRPIELSSGKTSKFKVFIREIEKIKVDLVFIVENYPFRPRIA